MKSSKFTIGKEYSAHVGSPAVKPGSKNTIGQDIKYGERFRIIDIYDDGGIKEYKLLNLSLNTWFIVDKDELMRFSGIKDRI